MYMYSMSLIQTNLTVIVIYSNIGVQTRVTSNANQIIAVETLISLDCRNRTIQVYTTQRTHTQQNDSLSPVWLGSCYI